MLGGLARWLRMLGYETEYDATADDNSLLNLSREQGAILLTRDAELYDRARARNLNALLVKGEKDNVRLAQMTKAYDISLEIEMSSSRCPECGSVLREISKEEASHVVQPHSHQLYDRFWRCTQPECGKTYWVGSHWKNIHQTLQEAREIATRE